MTPSPSLAAVVVAYNGGEGLVGCVRSLLTQSVAGLEVIVVDNASTDGSIERLRTEFGERLNIVRRGVNGGYGAGANSGWRATDAELIAILNQDLVLLPDCLERMRDVLLAAGPMAIVTPKLLLKSDPSRVNAIGNEVHLSGVAWCNALHTPADSWHGVREVTAISGAAFMARRSFLTELDGVEEGYFMYMEDVDLSLRARAAGGVCVAACDAVAIHDWSLTLSADRFGMLERNRRALWWRFWRGNARMLPALVQAELMGWLYALSHGRAYLRAKLRAGQSKRRLVRVEPGESLMRVLARRHPYKMLFPGSALIPAAGRMVDFLFAAPMGQTRDRRLAR